MEDWQLLEDFAEHRSEAAFTQLVERHLGLVLAAARRQVGDEAEDVAQAVFLLLAQKAGTLGRKVVLSGWLFRTTHFVATRALRSEYRRQRREQEAYTMQENQNQETGGNLFARALDENLAQLGETDRNALLLRFGEGRNHREVGAALGLTEEAAKKRVNRALERLRVALAGKGVALSVMLLASGLAERLVAAPPTGMAATISQRAVSGVIPGGVAVELARQVHRAWFWARLKFAAAVVGTVALVASLWMVMGSKPGVQGRGSGVAPVADGGRKVPAGPAGRAVPVGESFRLQVVAADSGEPIPGAKVLVHGATEVEDTLGAAGELVTDDQGVCHVPLPADSLVFLNVGVNAAGWENRYYNWVAYWDPPRPAGFELKLQRAETVGGRLVDAQQRPVPGAVVRAEAWVPDLSGRDPDPDREPTYFGEAVPVGVTDAEGRWVCTTLSPGQGQVRFEFTHPDFVAQTLSVDRTKDAAAWSDLRGRRTVTPLTAGALVRGQVVTPAGAPVAGARIALRWDDPGVITDTEGLFVVRSLPLGEQTLMATLDGFAPKAFVAEAGGSAARVALEPAGILRLRIVDVNGQPIPSVRVSLAPQDDMASQLGLGLVGWEARTDAEGRVTWRGAPPGQNLRYAIHRPGQDSGAWTPGRWIADGSEHTVTLPSALPQLRGEVLDAATGAPIPRFKVLLGYGDAVYYNFARDAFRYGYNGRYELGSISRGDELVRVEAEGYVTAIGVLKLGSAGEVRCDFSLQRERPNDGIRGLVRNPDGTPAAEVSVALCTLEAAATLSAGRFLPDDANPPAPAPLITHTDVQGRFTFPSVRAPHTVVAVSAAGFGRARARTGAAVEVRLESFGVIQGVIREQGEAVVGRVVRLTDRSFDRYPGSVLLEPATYQCRSDEQGRFQFGAVPPGVYQLAQERAEGRPPGDEMPVRVTSGHTTNVVLGDPDPQGRTVVVRVSAAEPGILNDWPHQLFAHTLVRSTPVPRVPEGLSPDDRRYWLVDWHQSPVGQAAALGTVSYTMGVAADGTLTARGVLPGEYTLHLSAREDSVTPAWRLRERRPVVISPKTPSGGLVDLGSMELRTERLAPK